MWVLKSNDNSSGLKGVLPVQGRQPAEVYSAAGTGSGGGGGLGVRVLGSGFRVMV